MIVIFALSQVLYFWTRCRDDGFVFSGQVEKEHSIFERAVIL